MAALARPHADRRETLEQLDIVIAFGDRVEDVGGLQILVEIDEILAVGMGEDRPGVIRAGAGVF